uniref:AB hydrolase-1 domain-containing protein n=1 Tax=Kalanchoe fedtschenkoi TaxID=63787 RepID=A0A7N0ULI8_KALFE
MDRIQHRFVEVRGLKLHVAEIGSGPNVVLFLHGFPEIWYSWRHQMLAVSQAGCRALAVDFRGYGLSDQPVEPEKTHFTDLVDDVISLLDTLGVSKVFLVGKDFGALPVFQLAIVCPERVQGIITLGIPFLLPGTGPASFPLTAFPKGFYILRWKEPVGRAEADFGRFDTKTVIRNIYILLSGSELQVASDDQEIMDLVEPDTPLPSWFSDEDLTTYASLYEKSGFRTALQVPYRTLDKDCGITDPKISVPAMLIIGEKDYVMKFPGIQDYIRGDRIKEFVPDLNIIFLPEGSHFSQEQFQTR